ncbi:OmpW family protein [Pseudoduganella sp. GCM10020061]|uniref:OmpW/AlkL family protein n=1 Tax=Pseudoduganella sp. GCM10020061 TaxID=3317345 RepID=UPI0036425CC8
MKKVVIAFALAAISAASTAAAQESPFMLRARAVHISPADKSDALGGAGARDRISVSDKTIAEFDITYFVTPNFSAELVLTYPQKHTVYLDGAAIGTFKHLPPTLLAQYRFAPGAQVQPYVGAGINLTRLSSVRLLGGAGDLENSSVGLALQAGADFRIDRNWSVNVDVKKVQIRSDVFVGGARASAVKVDPWLVGVGIGYRF